MTKTGRLPSANVTLALGPDGVPEDMVSQSSAALSNYRSLNRRFDVLNTFRHTLFISGLCPVVESIWDGFFLNIPYITTNIGSGTKIPFFLEKMFLSFFEAILPVLV